jgi:hypothetical protein
MAQTITLNFNIGITHDEFKALVQKWALTRRNQREIGAVISALDPELQAFDRYLEGQKMDPMGNVERQIVREFLGWILVREDTNG